MKFEVRCSICLGNIRDPGFLFECQCGLKFHVSCADGVAKCTACGREFSEEDLGESREFYSLIKDGKGALLKKEYMDAAGHFEKARLINEKSAYPLNLKGIALSEAGDHEKALECFESSLVSNDLHEIHYNKAVTFLRMTRYDEALSSIGSALAQKPEDVEYLYVKGFILSRSNRPEEAMECFNEVLKKNPEHTGAELEMENILSRG